MALRLGGPHLLGDLKKQQKSAEAWTLGGEFLRDKKQYSENLLEGLVNKILSLRKGWVFGLKSNLETCCPKALSPQHFF